MTLAIDHDLSRSVAVAGGQSLVFHCHFYNCALQRAIEEGLGDAAPAVLQGGAASVVHAQLAQLKGDGDAAATLALATAIHRELGFGMLDLGALTADGGEAVLTASHYAMGWVAVHGEREVPACFFSAGFVQAAFAAAHDLPLEKVSVSERGCFACGTDDCVFRVEVAS